MEEQSLNCKYMVCNTNISCIYDCFTNLKTIYVALKDDGIYVEVDGGAASFM